MEKVGSCVVSQLHMLGITHPSRVWFPLPIQLSGLVAQPCNPVTGGQGYWDGAGNPCLLKLVELEMACGCLGLWSRVESGLWDSTGPDHMELWHCKCTMVGGVTKAQDPINHTLNWKAPNSKSYTISCSPGRYEGSQSDCNLLATNGDIQAIKAGSPNVHIYLHILYKSGWRKRENGWWPTMPNKNH